MDPAGHRLPLALRHNTMSHRSRLQPGVMVVMGPMIIGLFFVGLLVQFATGWSWTWSSATPNWSIIAGDEQSWRSRQTARIAEGLDSALNAQIDEIGATAASGRAALMEQHSPEEAVRAFVSIQQRGRERSGTCARSSGHCWTSNRPILSPAWAS